MAESDVVFTYFGNFFNVRTNFSGKFRSNILHGKCQITTSVIDTQET